METIDGRAASAELSLMESKISRVCTRGDDFSAGGRIFRRLWRNFFFSSNSAGPLWTQLSGTADFFLSRFAGTSMKLPLRREMKDFISHIDRSCPTLLFFFLSSGCTVNAVVPHHFLSIPLLFFYNWFWKCNFYTRRKIRRKCRRLLLLPGYYVSLLY